MLWVLKLGHSYGSIIGEVSYATLNIFYKKLFLFFITRNIRVKNVGNSKFYPSELPGFHDFGTNLWNAIKHAHGTQISRFSHVCRDRRDELDMFVDEIFKVTLDQVWISAKSIEGVRSLVQKKPLSCFPCDRERWDNMEEVEQLLF